MKLIRLDRAGRRGGGEYETIDKRFHVMWHKKQGARSCYNVLDRQTDTSLRAFTLAEVHETIRDMLSNDRVRNLPLPTCDPRKDHPTTLVYLAVRQVPRRLLGPRIEDRYEAELRKLIGDVYVTIGIVPRTTRDLATKAARKLAERRGWVVSAKRVGWTTRDASIEREIDEDDKDYVEVAAETLTPPLPSPAESADLGCLICKSSASGLFCRACGETYDRAAEEFAGDEQAVMRWLAQAVRSNAEAVCGVVPTGRVPHKRCPRCAQRLRVVAGEIEQHMEVPSSRGGAPRQCLP